MGEGQPYVSRELRGGHFSVHKCSIVIYTWNNICHQETAHRLWFQERQPRIRGAQIVMVLHSCRWCGQEIPVSSTWKYVHTMETKIEIKEHKRYRRARLWGKMGKWQWEGGLLPYPPSRPHSVCPVSLSLSFSHLFRHTLSSSRAPAYPYKNPPQPPCLSASPNVFGKTELVIPQGYHCVCIIIGCQVVAVHLIGSRPVTCVPTSPGLRSVQYLWMPNQYLQKYFILFIYSLYVRS